MSNRSLANRNHALGKKKVDEMSSQLGAQIAVITYRKDGVSHEHASPSVAAVMDQFYDPAPKPIIAAHKEFALLDVDNMTLAEVNALVARLTGLATDVQARLV